MKIDFEMANSNCLEGNDDTHCSGFICRMVILYLIKGKVGKSSLLVTCLVLDIFCVCFTFNIHIPEHHLHINKAIMLPSTHPFHL